MRRTRSAVVLVVCVAGLAAWWWAGRPDDARPPGRAPGVTSSPDIDRVSDGRPPRACAGHDPRTADLDGDGRPEWVYLDWIEGRAVFGWCMGGRHGSLAARGMAEHLSVMDLYGDGRHEAIFGGNTCCGQVLQLAAYSGGRVRLVVRASGEPLALSNGLSPRNGRDRWTVYGCDANEGGALTQVVARLRGDELLVHRTRYEVDGATARVIGRDTGTIPDPGPRLRARDVSETVGGCMEIFEPS